MRQNRVDPMGQLHAVAARGAMMGNRGCLHDDHGAIRHHHVGSRWITCLTAFGDRRRSVMTPGAYTELFFLDEATAYAAGHRPCAECRRPAFRAFTALWQAEYGETGVPAIDARLQAARWSDRSRRLVDERPGDIPPGGIGWLGEDMLLRTFGGWWRWSFEGYTRVPEPLERMAMITPEPIARLLWRGLPVAVHPSAQ